jgi:hypothetical protein
VDPTLLHWESGSDLFYAVTWFDVCLTYSGRTRRPYAPECGETDWITVIDASTGAFIVGGTAEV